MTLTKPQLALLRDVESGRRTACIDNYRPMLTLVQCGLLVARPQKFGQLKLAITQAGRDAIQVTGEPS